MQLPDPIEGVQVLESLKTEITSAYNTLKDSPGRRTIGFLCGHEEFCPFTEQGSLIPDELVQAFAQQPFIKKAVDDIKNLEGRLNQHNEAIRNFFLSKGYRLIEVQKGNPVPEEVDALMVYGPRKPFDEIDFYDVDQFVLTGKPVVFWLNNFHVMVNQWDESPPYNLVTKIESTDTNLDPFLNHYGIQNNKDLVMETHRANYERINTVNIQMSNIGPLPMTAKYRYPLFPVFENFSETDPMVSGLRRVTLPFVSSFQPTDTLQPGLTVEPLIQSSEDAVSKSADFVLDPRALKDSVTAEQTAGRLAVAVHVTGEATSYFAGRARPARAQPEANEEGAPPAPEIKERRQLDSGSINVVVIGSNLGFENLGPGRLLEGFNLGQVAQEKVTGLGAAIPFYIRYVNAWGRLIGQQNPVHFGERGRLQALPGQQTEFLQKNLDFLFGVFDWATGETGLAAIRAKADTERPLKVESELQRRTITWGLLAGLPLLLLLFGWARRWWRFEMRKRLA